MQRAMGDDPPVVDSRAGRILVVDDEPNNRQLLGDLLEAQGHKVTLAEDGQQALDLAFADLPDVVLLDVMMPGMNGYEVCRRLKADSRTAPIPILMVTSLADRADRIRGVASGADDFLTKPIDREELVLRVRNSVYRKHLYDELQCKYRELRAMAELRQSLTHLIDADTETMADLLGQRLQQERPAEGMPDTEGASRQEGSEHGAH